MFTADQLALAWISFGVGLMLLETLLPGLIAVFLGMAALAVGAGVWFGWLNSWSSMLTSWFILSLVLLFTLRNLFAKMAPGDTHVGDLQEEDDPTGAIVIVTREVGPGRPDGRVKHRGTTWAARCEQHVLHPGQKARVVADDGAVWVIEPI